MPARLTFDVSRLRSLQRKIGPEFAKAVKSETLRRYSPVLHRRLAENSPGKGPGRTGNFRRSWAVFPDRTGDVLFIVNRASYAKFVEDDTRPHRIPKTGTPGVDRKVLVWRTGRRGPISAFKVGRVARLGRRIGRLLGRRPGATDRKNFVFVGRAVMHPGTKGQQIVPRSIEETAADFARLTRDATLTVTAPFLP